MKRFFLFFTFIALIVAGCTSDYTVLESIGSISLTADKSSTQAGELITFTVINSNGENITESSTIYVDNQPIEGNTFTSETYTTHEVKASYAGLESNSVTINFHDGSETNFVKRVLIEDYTGTWCGYCPRVAHAIELVKAQTDEPNHTAVAVSIHRPSSNPNSLNYDPYNYDTSQLEALLSTAGYPKGYLNRMTLWQSPEPNNLNQAIALTQGENPKLGLAMTSSVNNGNIALDVNVKFSKDFEGLKLVVYILENGLIYEQHNYTDYYGGVDVIEDFEHNHVLRQCITPLLGEAINGVTTTGETYTKTFNVAVPANVENAANLEFVAFIVDGNGNAINVRSAKPDETQEFEEI
ncbi:Omp28-related outer membrane protein [Flavobacterium alkalisoli]|uniref:Omp28-related outer membrane protein n=1 Tax=Flavobacterium alkalisoli TaxID=2602769 RepID=UPI003A958E4F